VIAPNGYVIHESTSCADYLMHKHGLPPLRILKEVCLWVMVQLP
jgi:hypothetical protein